jgi:thioredoxin 1
MSEHVSTLTDANWDTEVMKSAEPVLVDFWASWCQPCIAMAPDLDAVAQEHKGRLKVGKVNVEENELPSKYGITAMPTLLVFKGGKVVDQKVGRLTKAKLADLVKPHLG